MKVVSAIDVYSTSCDTFDVIPIRAIDIRTIVVAVIIGDISRAAKDIANSVTRHTIAKYPWTSDVNIWNKNPIVIG